MSVPQLEDGYTRISNELLDALIGVRIPGEARQVLDMIIRKTYGYGKKGDHISTSQFQAATGMSKGSIHRARRKLLEMNIISVSKKGYTSILMYSIQKIYKNWRVYPKKDTVSQKATGCIPKSNQVYPKKRNTKETLTKETLQKKGEAPKPFEARNYASAYSVRQIKLDDIPEPVRSSMVEFGIQHFRGNEKDVRISLAQFQKNYESEHYGFDAVKSIGDILNNIKTEKRATAQLEKRT